MCPVSNFDALMQKVESAGRETSLRESRRIDVGKFFRNVKSGQQSLGIAPNGSPLTSMLIAHLASVPLAESTAWRGTSQKERESLKYQF